MIWLLDEVEKAVDGDKETVCEPQVYIWGNGSIACTPSTSTISANTKANSLAFSILSVAEHKIELEGL